jgi:hypothetical protein
MVCAQQLKSFSISLVAALALATRTTGAPHSMAGDRNGSADRVHQNTQISKKTRIPRSLSSPLERRQAEKMKDE